MTSVELKARAKINLSLDVLQKRPDGYHDIKMIMQSIELHDSVSIQVIDKGIQISCNLPWVPSDSQNIAYKAAHLLINKYNLDRGVRIRIEKKIPVSAGLAGGSADAAAVLMGMNQLFGIGLDDKELSILGKQLGADVPFCINGGTMLSEGIGEILTELKPFEGVNIVLVKPKFSVSTEWVYRNLVLDEIKERPDMQLLITALENNDIDSVAKNMKNVLEIVTQKKYGVIQDIKNRLLELGACGSMMSGSGPTVFGIFSDRQSAEKAFEKIKTDKWECYLTETICKGDR